MKQVAKVTIPKHERQTVLNRYFDEYKYFRFPYFIIILSLVEISTFTYRWVFYGPFASSQMVDNILIYDPHKRKEVKLSIALLSFLSLIFLKFKIQ